MQAYAYTILGASFDTLVVAMQVNLILVTRLDCD